MILTELVLASGNAGKLHELQSLLGPTGIKVRTQRDFGVPEVEETGECFLENAILKARAVARHTGLPALADDSGLVVDALCGRPGVRSARYAGEEARDVDNNARLLQELAPYEEADRSARYCCALVLMRHATDPMPLCCFGTWEGRILRIARGAGGFGYDPLFEVPGSRLSAAELDPATKNSISHRGKALQQLLAELGAQAR